MPVKPANTLYHATQGILNEGQTFTVSCTGEWDLFTVSCTGKLGLFTVSCTGKLGLFTVSCTGELGLFTVSCTGEWVYLLSVALVSGFIHCQLYW